MAKKDITFTVIREDGIAERNHVSESFVYMLCHPRYNKFTENPELAIDLAKLTGKKPINYMPKRLRKYYLLAVPKLNG